MVSLLSIVAQVSIAVSVPDTVGVGEPFVVTVTASATTDRAPVIIPPSFAPFTLTGVADATSMSREGAEARTQVTSEYTLAAESPGHFTIGAFEARLGTVSRRTIARAVVVSAAHVGRAPRVGGKASPDANEPVNVFARATPDTVYVGQELIYEVGMVIEESVRSRLRRNPSFTPPETRGVIVYDLPATAASTAVRGSRYEPHVYRRAMFPLVAGRLMIPAAQLQYSLPLSTSFFSREESHVLRTDSIGVLVRALPDVGRPANFSGAVGHYTIETVLDTARARVGDPSMLTVRVTGRGNIRMLPRPIVEIPWASLVAASERVQLDTTASSVRGTKEFSWVVTPRDAGDLDMPVVRYPFFNPDGGRYEEARSVPSRVRVAPGTLVAEVVSADSVVPPAIRPVYRGAVPTPFHERPIFWVLLVLAPGPAVVAAIVRRPRTARRVSAERRLRALASQPTRTTDSATVRKALVNALAERLDLPPGALASRSEFVRALRHAGVTEETAARANALLSALDVAAYGTSGDTAPNAQRDAYDVMRAVSAEARARSATAAKATVLVSLAIAGLVMTGIAASQNAAASLFARGVDEYGARRYAAAAQLFRAATRAEPRAPDAWANLATASAMAGDTAIAVVGWQRALRLEPRAVDARDQLDRTRPSTPRSLGWVPRVPTAWFAVSGALLWVVAWALAFVIVRKRTRVPSRRAWIGAIACAVVAGAAWIAAARNDTRIAGRDLVVIADVQDVRSMPALGAEPSGRLAAGDIARVRRTQGAWMLVEIDGGRDGWITSDHLISLSDR
jgi:tetratricopeptide (TPR) repeat protein